MPTATRPIAELGMYPFASVRWAWDALWEGVHERAAWVPPALAHTGDVHARWADPACLVNHVCGWPLARYHAADQVVVGAFALSIPEADGHHYRSTLVSPRNAPLSELVADRVTVAANSDDSLSGWVSLLHATVGRDRAWPGEVLFTGAHVESLRAVQRGEAELACIDSWSLALIGAEQPELVGSLHRVGLGPLIPTPAITVRDTVDPSQADELGAAIAAAVADPSAADLRVALMIAGFDATTLDDYLPVLDLIGDPA